MRGRMGRMGRVWDITFLVSTVVFIVMLYVSIETMDARALAISLISGVGVVVSAVGTVVADLLR